MEHVTLSALHCKTLEQGKKAEAQIPTLGFDVNEKHSQSEFDEQGVRWELHAVELHIAVVLAKKENTEKGC